MQNHLGSIDQYLRINNVETVGLPDPSDDESHEQVLLEALNSLQDLTVHISHPIPNRHYDGKKVSVCKFVSRKTKIDVIEPKKKNQKTLNLKITMCNYIN